MIASVAALPTSNASAIDLSMSRGVVCLASCTPDTAHDTNAIHGSDDGRAAVPFAAEDVGVRDATFGGRDGHFRVVPHLRDIADDADPSDGEIIAVAVQAVAHHFSITPDAALIRLAEIAEWVPLELTT